MTRRAKYPTPPIEKMLPGQVWEVSVLQRLHQNARRLGEPKQAFIKFLLLIIDPKDHGWPAAKNRWYHSVFRLGDLQKRTREAVLLDIDLLLKQDPPYIQNYKPLTKMHQGDYIYWEHAIDLEKEKSK